MERRKFLIGMGAAAAGSAATIGSGAFSNAQVNRTALVSVAGDQDAYLGLESTSEYTRMTEDTTLEINFGDTTSGGSGLNKNGVMSFNDIFKITNQGTRNIAVWFDDGRAEGGQIGDQYWSEGNFNQKVEEALANSAGHAEDYYNFYTEDGNSGGLTENFPDTSLAPWNIDPAEISNPVINGAVLGTGSSTSVDAYFGDTGAFESDVTDAKITIWAYSRDYAQGVQNE